MKGKKTKEEKSKGKAKVREHWREVDGLKNQSIASDLLAFLCSLKINLLLWRVRRRRRRMKRKQQKKRKETREDKGRRRPRRQNRYVFGCWGDVG